MYAYWKYFRTSVYENFYFRVDYIMRFLTSFLQSYTLVAIWFYITMSAQDNLEPILIERSIKYMVLVSSFTIAFRALPDNEITKAIQSGDIVRNLILPVNFPTVIFFKSIGNIVALFFIQVIPIFIFLTLTYDIHWNIGLMNLTGIIIGCSISCYLFFLINLLFDTLAFWLFETTYFRYMKSAFIAFFSGSIAPLWFYPVWLQSILNFLPFRQIYYNPIAFYLEELSTVLYLKYLLVAGIWLIGFQVLFWLMWKNGVKRVVQFGG